MNSITKCVINKIKRFLNEGIMENNVIKLVDNYMQQHIFVPYFGKTISSKLENSGITYVNAIAYELTIGHHGSVIFRLELINKRLELIISDTKISDAKILANTLIDLDHAIKSHYQDLIVHFS